MKKNILLLIAHLLIPMLLITACGNSAKANGNSSKTTEYFMALQFQKEGNKEDAIRFFEKATKSDNPLIAKKASEALCTMGDISENCDASLKLYRKYKDQSALLLTCQALEKNHQYGKILSLVSDIDVETCDNQIAAIKIKSMYETGSSRFLAELKRWCLNRDFSKLHCRILRDIFIDDETLSDQVRFRTQIYDKKYTRNYSQALEYLENPDFQIPQLYSDIGKTLLYGSNSYFENALALDKVTKSLSKECRFYAQFYSGRLYDKAENYCTQACNRFLSAMNNADTDLKYDNALWYFLNTKLKISAEEAIDATEKYSAKWHDSTYFDDFYEKLNTDLIGSKKWNLYIKFANKLNSGTSPETRAKIYYTAARLIQEGYADKKQIPNDVTPQKLFNQCLETRGSLYYMFMAAKQLNLSGNELKEQISKYGEKQSGKIDFYADQLMKGYAQKGFPELIYDEWLVYRDQISMETSQMLSKFLRDLANDQNDYYEKSLRIASRKFNYPEKDNSEEIMKLSYPQDFEEYVKDACSQFGVPEYMMYALIRSESFFNPVAKSGAGAKGLTQLMDVTAGDVAQRLRIKEYDLGDARTNIKFGTWYLQEMYKKIENNWLLAYFAYNAGRKTVKNWIPGATMQFETKNLPVDLFLESLPFAETREYGRKIISAACMYGMLYNNKSPYEIIDMFMEYHPV